MFYDEFHNHKWALNLKHARQLLEEHRLYEFYYGEDLPEGDVYPGMLVMAVYWISLEHEMRLRRLALLQGANHLEWENNPELVAQAGRFFARYLDDMRRLIEREGIAPLERVGNLAARGWETPIDWAEKIRDWQRASQEALADDHFPAELAESWFNSCLRSVANYNRYLIWGAVNTAGLVKREGEEALRKAVDANSEEFMWEIGREFFASVIPTAGFVDISDLTEIGARGIYADQLYVRGEERQEGERTIRQSILKNCALAGIFQQVAEWNNISGRSLGYGICRYCEVRGQVMAMITMPRTVTPAYRRVESLGMEGAPCLFELITVTGDDTERVLMVQEKIFGSVE